MAPTSNRELIPIYTDWANRHLIRYGAEPINDLTNDLSEPRRLVTLLQAITFDCVPAAEERISTAINGRTESAEIIAGCLQFVESLNVDISKVAVNGTQWMVYSGWNHSCIVSGMVSVESTVFNLILASETIE
ncbi:hypothetical protein ACH3XW_26530 [Acanthocheilonema viteae]